MMKEFFEKNYGLTVEQATAIHDYYETYSTAEYLMEKYPDLNEEKAVSTAEGVRILMDKYDYTEEEAIERCYLA